ncbi:MAG: M3 family metallopeptidase, partial [Stappiaceae bacterium]
MTDIENPLLQQWTTPFKVPPFELLTVDHFRDGFDQALQQHRAEINSIADNEAEPTFQNTVAALEQSGKALDKVAGTFFNLTGAHTNEALQGLEREIAPQLARHSNEMLLNRKLFLRLETLMNAGASLGLDSEQARVLERYVTRFERAGARLVGEERDRVAAITQQLAELTTNFSQNLLSDEKDFELLLEAEEDLAGLPDFLIEAAHQEASERGYEGKYLITLSRSSIMPFLQFSSRRDLREKAFRGWTSRGENGGATDNRQLVRHIVALRAERARLLEYESYADFRLSNEMAKTPTAVRDLLMAVWEPARRRAEEEQRKLQDIAAAEGENFTIAPWDWQYYAEKLRKLEHDINEAELKPYFQLDRMIEAVFYTANKLFGLTVKERHDLDLYHPDVRAFDVSDREGAHIGLFLADFFARPSKRSGAWMSSFRDQQKLAGDIRPIVVNVMNFSKVQEGQTPLLSFDDARTLFHEFGHALHGLLSDVTYPLLSGTSVSRDFVELPSQLFEHWLSEPEILSRFATHYKTGEPMPQELLKKLLAAENFNQGFATVEYVSTAIVDLELHLLKDADDLDVSVFEEAALAKLDMPKGITMRHRTPHL